MVGATIHLHVTVTNTERGADERPSAPPTRPAAGGPVCPWGAGRRWIAVCAAVDGDAPVL